MIVQEILTTRSNNNDQLDRILIELCDMILDGQRARPEHYGLVAACVIDPQGREGRALNYYAGSGKRVHAERAAVMIYNKKYGKLPDGSLMVTTLSPCTEHTGKMSQERAGISCSELMDQLNIRRVYCGYMDPTQDHLRQDDFDCVVTNNDQIQQVCQEIADCFLKKSVSESADTQLLNLAAAKMGYQNHLQVPLRQQATLHQLASTIELNPGGQYTPTAKDLHRYQRQLNRRRQNQQAVNFAASHWDPDEEMLETNYADPGNYCGEATDATGPFTTLQQVKDYFRRIGKTEAQAAAAWQRGYRGPKQKTKPVPPYDPKQHDSYWWNNDDLDENFADGRVKGRSRPGRVKRAGASCKGSVSSLRARARKASGEKQKMYHWCANMKSGKKK